jgi:four helix bundle protein
MPYEKFAAWRVAHELVLEVYRVTDQCVSAPTNIAEGAAKRGKAEFGRYLDIALGSLSELSYLLRFSKDRGLLNNSSWESLNLLRGKAGLLLWKLYRSVRPMSH